MGHTITDALLCLARLGRRQRLVAGGRGSKLALHGRSRSRNIIDGAFDLNNGLESERSRRGAREPVADVGGDVRGRSASGDPWRSAQCPEVCLQVRDLVGASAGRVLIYNNKTEPSSHDLALEMVLGFIQDQQTLETCRSVISYIHDRDGEVCLFEALPNEPEVAVLWSENHVLTSSKTSTVRNAV